MLFNQIEISFIDNSTDFLFERGVHFVEIYNKFGKGDQLWERNRHCRDLRCDDRAITIADIYSKGAIDTSPSVTHTPRKQRRNYRGKKSGGRE